MPIIVTANKMDELQEIRTDAISAIEYLAKVQWRYFAYVLPSILFCLFFYLRNKKSIFSSFNEFIKWVKHSFEQGGHASPEKLTAFAVTSFSYIPTRLIFALQVTEPKHLLLGSILDAVYVCVLYRIITPQQVMELKNGLKISDEPKKEA
jgi:hypothetical protein